MFSRYWVGRRLAAAVAVVLGVSLWGAAPAHAAQPESSAFVQSLGDEVIAVLQNSKLDKAQRKQALHALFVRAFDIEGIARYVLGRHWRTATEKQQAEYLKLFGGYMVGIYADQFVANPGDAFAVRNDTAKSETENTVEAELVRPDALPIALDFRVVRHDREYKIADVTVNRLSFVLTKRDEFGAFVGRRGIDSLIAHLAEQSGTPN
jgi:phospholipid transport system substrate-binding protein